MPLTTALYTGMSGLNANQTALDVIGNNIANVNTVAFKGARALFQPEFSETYSFGTPPGTVFGGSNPSQKGLGVRVSKIQRDFAAGNVKLTGVATDIAIDGDGMFVIEDSQRYFTRNGQFVLNSDNYLVTPTGSYVMGYSVDENYNIVEGSLTRIRIPLYRATVARATSNVVLDGQLGGADIEVGTQGTTLQSDQLTDTTVVGGEVTGTSRLVDLLSYDPTTGTSQQVFFDNTTVTFEGQRDEQLQGPKTLEVTLATTMEDLSDFMVQAFGVNEDSSITPTGTTPAGGALVGYDTNGDLVDDRWCLEITGNVGTANTLAMGIRGLQSTSATVPGPLAFQETVIANGASVHTGFTVYDSLGNPKRVDLTCVFENEDNSGRTWRFFANSLDDSEVSTVLGTGTIDFDTEGNFLNATGTTITIDLDSSGVISPLSVTLDLDRLSGIVSSSGIGVSFTSQDGEPPGTLTGFSLAEDGQIVGTFNNGYTHMLGQIALAVFSNYGGLIDAGENVFKAGPNSGEAMISAPLSNGAGQLFAGAVETSNVDISRQFIDMIVASTGFSASSRVITTSNQLLTELLSLVR